MENSGLCILTSARARLGVARWTAAARLKQSRTRRRALTSARTMNAACGRRLAPIAAQSTAVRRESVRTVRGRAEDARKKAVSSEFIGLPSLPSFNRTRFALNSWQRAPPPQRERARPRLYSCKRVVSSTHGSCAAHFLGGLGAGTIEQVILGQPFVLPPSKHHWYRLRCNADRGGARGWLVAAAKADTAVWRLGLASWRATARRGDEARRHPPRPNMRVAQHRTSKSESLSPSERLQLLGSPALAARARWHRRRGCPLRPAWGSRPRPPRRRGSSSSSLAGARHPSDEAAAARSGRRGGRRAPYAR